MGILDSFRKDQEKKEKHSTPPPKGHTLAEILQDRRDSQLFGSILEQDGHHDLAARVIQGQLNPDDIELLEEERLKFSEKITKSEMIGNLLTEETVVDIARNHSDFEKIINLVGPKKAIKAIRSQLRVLCVEDEYRFNAVADPIEVYNSYKEGEYKKVNDEIEKFCKENKISPKEYMEAMAEEDPDEKEAMLRKLAKKSYGGFMKGLDNFVNGKFSGGKTRDQLDSLMFYGEGALAVLKEYEKDIGDALFCSVSEDDALRNALSRELVSENAPAAEPEVGFRDMKKETFDEKAFDADWETYKKQSAYGTDTPEGQEKIKDMFIAKQKKQHQEQKSKKGGFWYSIMSALFEQKIDSKENTLK